MPSSPLADLLTPGAVEPFLRDRWPGVHGVTHGPLARLPAFFQSPLLADPRELARVYRGPVQVTNLGVGQYPVPLGPVPNAYFEDLGLSVRFSNIDTLLPGARAWLRALEDELGVPRGCSTMSAFANAPGSGLVVHCDRTEQFAIHLVGEKRFRVRPSPVAFPTMRHCPLTHGGLDTVLQAPDGLPTHESLAGIGTPHHLQPGSVLFTPRGLYHETLASRGVALTVVIAIENPCPADLVTSYLRRYLLQSAEWRRPLARAWSQQPGDRAAATAQLRGLVGGLTRSLARLDLDLMLDGHDPAALLVRDCRPASRFQRDRGVVVRLGAPRGDEVTVTVPATPNSEPFVQVFPRLLAPALRWVIASRAAFTLEALGERYPRWDPSALAAMLVFLVRARALHFLPVQALDDFGATVARGTRQPPRTSVHRREHRHEEADQEAGSAPAPPRGERAHDRGQRAPRGPGRPPRRRTGRPPTEQPRRSRLI